MKKIELFLIIELVSKLSLGKAAADVSPSGVFDGVDGLFHRAADL